MSDPRIWRTTCPHCGKRVTVGPASRIYNHKRPDGTRCVEGHGIRVERGEDARAATTTNPHSPPAGVNTGRKDA